MVIMVTANLKLIQLCYEINLSKFYIPKKYEECSIYIMLEKIAVLSYTAFYRLVTIATSNATQTLAISSV